jgi:predicted phage tail protein/sulfur carrier protein ThiS
MLARYVHMKDPFRPSVNRETGVLVPGHRINDVLRQKGFIKNGRRTHAYIVLVNGQAVLQRQWKRRIRDNDIVTVANLPRGGGGSNPLQIIAMLALVVASIYFPALWGLKIGTLAYAAASASIMIGGSLLLNMVFKAPTTAISTTSNAQASPTYSLTAQGNTARLLSPIPVTYGRMQTTPDFAAVPYTEMQANDQYLYQLFCIGQGYLSVESINIGDTPIGNFPEIQYEVVQPNAAVTLFPTNVVTSTDVSSQVLYGPNNASHAVIGPWVANPAGTTTTFLAVDVSLPAGAFKVSDSGAYTNTSVAFLFEYQAINDSGTAIGNWTTLVQQTLTFATATPQRLSYKVAVPSGRYQVRAQRTNNDANGDTRTSDTLQWDNMRAYLQEPSNYGNITLLAVIMKATNTLNSQSSRSINVVSTRMLQTWDPVNGWTVNPVATRSAAWALADIIRNSYYGRNLPDSRYNLQKLYTLDQTLSARGDTFNYVFDTTVQLWDALTTVGNAVRTIPIYYAGLIDFIRNEPKSIPTAMFSPQNMVQNSFNTTYQFADVDTPDYVVAQFFDETTWTTNTVDCILPGGTSNTPSTIVFDGITNHDQAWREGITKAAQNAYQRRLISFTAELDGLLPQYGDLVQVSHDVPAWGYSGYVVSFDYNLGILVTSEPCPMDSNATAYVVAFRKRDGSADGPYTVTRAATGESTHLQLAGTAANWANIYISDGIRTEMTFYQFGPTLRAGLQCLAMNAQPSDDGNVQLSLCNYASQVYAAETGGILPPLNPVSNLPTPPQLPIVDSVTLSYTYAIGQQTIVASPANGAQYYEFQASPDSGATWIQFGTSILPQMTVALNVGTWLIRARAINDNIGPWTTASVTVVATTLPTVSIGAFTATGIVFGVNLAWTIAANNGGIAKNVEIWHGLNAVLGNAVLLGTFPATTTNYTHGNMGPGETHYYWIRCIDQAGRQGPWFNSGVATVGQSSSDTTAILAQLNNSITSSQLSAALLATVNAGPAAQVSVNALTTQLAAMYTIKTQLTVGGHTYIAGIGVGVENTGGIIESQVLVAASRFAVVDPTSSLISTPFVITGGVTYISSAFIQNASITNAKISGVLQSDAVNGDGQALWSLDRSGVFQFFGTGSYATQKLVINSTQILLYNANVPVIEISTALSGT